MSPVCCDVPAKWIRLVCLVLFFAVVLSSLPVHLKHDSANAQGSGRRRTQGPPSSNLPNLDETRGIEPGTSRIMPPVPATKCRGRDEKCKKAKGKISSNLPGNQDRLLAYAGHRSRRDYAGWLKIVIPALSMLDDLIYGSARMISDFPDMPYRNHGDVLAKSAVKLTNPRSETYGDAALGSPRKEYGRSGRSIITAQSVVSVSPGANQTPDSGQGGSAVSSPSNIGHGNTVAHKSNGGFLSRTCRWFSFQSVSGQILSISLKADWSIDGMLEADGTNEFSFQYSTNNGSSWATAVFRSNVTAPDSGSVNISLSPSQDLTLVQVRDRFAVQATEGIGFDAQINVSVSNIRIEVETDTTAPVISNVAAGGITTSSATITWTTNENSDSQVEYGPTTAYGQLTTLNPALVTAHSQGLSGLTAGTLYHYRVKSRDAAGNLAVSGAFTFTTVPPDTTAPASPTLPQEALPHRAQQLTGPQMRIPTARWSTGLPQPTGNRRRSTPRL